jgi:hypothetical protein
MVFLRKHKCNKNSTIDWKMIFFFYSFKLSSDFISLIDNCAKKIKLENVFFLILYKELDEFELGKLKNKITFLLLN